MLVLTRKQEEQIVIGDAENQIIITVLKIQGSEKVSIGIEAPPSTPIFRKELLSRNSHKKKRPSSSSSASKDLNRLIEAVHMAEEESLEQDNSGKENEAYNCYLP